MQKWILGFKNWLNQGSPLAQSLKKSISAMLAFVLLPGILLMGVYQGTKEPIAYQEKQTQLRLLNALVPQDHYNNHPLEDKITIRSPQYTGYPQTQAYVFRNNGRIIALATPIIAPDGYSGNIYLLVAVYATGEVAGVRVVKHNETPGLGDKIERDKTDWILSFNHKKLSSSNLSQWAVKKDGGQFDQFTGATITPRAVVKAVKKWLLYLNNHPEIWHTPEKKEKSQ